MAPEVDKTRQGLLKQHYRKPLARKTSALQRSPIESSRYCSFLCQEVLPIVCGPFTAVLTVENNNFLTYVCGHCNGKHTKFSLLSLATDCIVEK